MIDNPWNEFFEKFVINDRDKLVKDMIVLKTDANIYVIQSIPAKFQKLKDLVLCNSCEILVSKRNCIYHAKLHNHLRNKLLPYNVFPLEDKHEIHGKNKTVVIDNINVEKSSLNNLFVKDKKRKIINKTKISNSNKMRALSVKNDDSNEKSPEENTNFIPQSIISSLDPLKLKIRLQPISNCETKNHANNGNIFENLNNYYKDINSNSSVNVCRIKSLDEFINENDDDNSTNYNDEMQTTGSLFHSEKVAKIRRIDPIDSCKQNWSTHLVTGPRSSGISCVNKSIIPIRLQCSSNVRPSSISISNRQFPMRPALDQPKSNDVFQNINNNSNNNNNNNNHIIRIRGQPKRVRIQKLTDAPQNWQISTSENPTTNFQNQEATQRQFQRRLIQQGMISESDIVRYSRSNIESEFPGPRRKFTIINGQLPRDSRLQVIRKVTPVTINSGTSFNRVTESRNQSNTIQAVPNNQRNQLYNRIVLARNNSMSSLPQPTIVHNPGSRRCQNVSKLELSDEEFLLESQYQNSQNTNVNIASSVNNVNTSQQYQSNDDIIINNDNNNHQKDSYLSIIRPNQRSDQEIPRHKDKNEANDPSIHFLPPPGSQITGLPWDS